ncbi:MAG: hypothetical protein ACK56I_09990, partial [bacterium]
MSDINIKFDIDEIPQSLRQYFNIFKLFFTQIGVKDFSLESFENLK